MKPKPGPAPRLRRSVYAFFHYSDHGALDVGLLLRGTAQAVPVREVSAISILTGEESVISREDLSLLYDIPSDRWIAGDGVDEVRARALAEQGLVLLDVAEEPFRELRERDERLASNQWNIYGALYHFMTKWRGVDFREGLGDDVEFDEVPVVPPTLLREFLGRYGEPPSPFHSAPGALSVHRLPRVPRRGPVYETLLERRTARSFDRTTPLTLDELAVVLYYVYGCHGYAPIVEGVVGLKKTSPSGGALHPVEVYPLITCVDGLEAGLYHYSPENHSLELLERVSPEDGVALASRFTCGQTYFGSAHVTLLLTARFYRSFWKYRKHQRAYAALLMDAAHLSQTLYLVCTDLGLGAFVTVAINGAEIEERLGLDGVGEGSIAVCGFGRRGEDSHGLEPEFLPYEPGETRL